MVYAWRNTRIFGDQCGQHGLKGLDVGLPIECNLGPKNAGEWIPGTIASARSRVRASAA